MNTTVSHNPSQKRNEIHVDDQLAGFSEYKLNPGRIAFTHAQVDPSFSGRGVARQLVDEELEDARRRGLAVQPFCPYVREVIVQKPDKYLDLVPAKDRERFKLPVASSATDPGVEQRSVQQEGQR